MFRVGIALLAVSVAAVAHGDGDILTWPRFRGPNGSGVADRQRPPIEVGPEKNVKWKIAVPAGLSSPIVAGDLLVLTAFDEEKLWTIAYNRADGREVWRAESPVQRLEAYHQPDGSPAASTPTTDGERIVSYFGSCGLVCHDLLGKELWRYELPTVETMGSFGTGVSPVIEEGVVLLLRDAGSDSKLIALDLATGKLKWEKPRTSRGGFSTPVIWETPEGKQVVAAGHGRLIGYDLANGDEKWFVDGMPTSCCASPVTADGNLYFAAWSPGAAGDKSFQLPPFKLLLLADGDGDGLIGRNELAKSPLHNFFDTIDADKDGGITQQEWETTSAFMAASKNSAFAVRPGGKGDVTATHVKWLRTNGLPYVPSSMVYDGQHLMVKDGGIVTAYDAQTGDEIFQKRAVASGGYYASPVAANGYVYFTSLSDGVITVLKSGATTPAVAVKNLPLGERVSATPAIADDTLYVRTAGHMYAFCEEDAAALEKLPK